MRALVGQMLRLPFAVAGYMFELLGETAKSLEQIAEQTFRDVRQPFPAAAGDDRRKIYDPPDTSPTAPPAPPFEPTTPSTTRRPFDPVTKEERNPMTDTNLNDDMVKLVEYTILTIEREKEELLEGPRQVIVTDDLTGNAFSNARIARWTERTGGKRTGGEGGRVDPDTLRVYYNVLDRWPKEDLKKDERSLRYDEEQIKVLREIAAKLPPASSGGRGKAARG